MSDNNNTTKILLAVVVLGLLVAAGFYFMTSRSAPAPDATLAQEVAAADEAAPGSAAPTLDIAAALTERVLGNPAAPIKISEHSSLTCPHCAHFHRDTLPRLKAEYIDTGKAYLVFSDFPLNAPALQASSLARCLPQDQYFPFIESLFATQDSWAFEPDYLARLKAEGMKAGLDEATATACLQSKEIQDGITTAMKGAQEQWGVNSTPALVINNKKLVPGSSPYEEIVKALNEDSAATPSEAGETPAAPEAELPQDMPPQPEAPATEAQPQETPATP